MRSDGIHHPIFVFRIVAPVCLFVMLAGCDDAGSFSPRSVFKSGAPAESVALPAENNADGTERDVEAPDVFSAREAGLWDGRPSLGGVWVAHPEVTEPERVIIKNQSNGRSVVGALFRRERDIPGPRLQMSSDAAEALGVLAGAPAELDVTALRKEVAATPLPARTQQATDGITQTALDPVAPESAAQTTATGPATASALDKPYLQIGIFSQEPNADRVAKQMRTAGLAPTIKAQEAGGKRFWRVLVGPAITAAERERLLTTIRSEGFSDAYAVTN